MDRAFAPLLFACVLLGGTALAQAPAKPPNAPHRAEGPSGPTDAGPSPARPLRTASRGRSARRRRPLAPYRRADGTLDWDALERDLAPYRRADGSLDWDAVSADRPLVEGAGLAQFGLALFLKELAHVARTGDRARIEEFYDGLWSLDFFVHYGAFLVGVGGVEVAYARFLAPHLRPGFVRVLLRNNLMLAAGLTLSRLMDGRVDGGALVLSLVSLGLSSAALRAGLSALEWVVDLRRARGGLLARLGRAGPLARSLGGWAYVVGELTVILLGADAIEAGLRRALDARAARRNLASAALAFLDAAARADAPEDLAAAVAAHAEAWGRYRAALLAPLVEVESTLARRLDRAARQAKLLADTRRAALAHLRDKPALRAQLLRRHGSLAAYADALVREETERLDRSLRRATSAYLALHERALARIESAPRRGSPLLAGLDPAAALAEGPRGRARVLRALRRVSRNTDESYADEAEVLAAARTRVRPALRGVLDAARARVHAARAAEAARREGDLPGLLGALGAAERAR
ncbi:MAG: hypothetical protein D6731_08920 [Planctomycetota bacterium]|nr:MAG: hypothetical protein D6731_08920 [Planctomycetota bacterium]